MNVTAFHGCRISDILIYADWVYQWYQAKYQDQLDIYHIDTLRRMNISRELTIYVVQGDLDT